MYKYITHILITSNLKFKIKPQLSRNLFLKTEKTKIY